MPVLCMGKHGTGSFQSQHLQQLPLSTHGSTQAAAPFQLSPLELAVLAGTLFCSHSPWKTSVSTYCFQGEFLQLQHQPRAEEKACSLPALNKKIHTW